MSNEKNEAFFFKTKHSLYKNEVFFVENVFLRQDRL